MIKRNSQEESIRIGTSFMCTVEKMDKSRILPRYQTLCQGNNHVMEREHPLGGIDLRSEGDLPVKTSRRHLEIPARGYQCLSQRD